MLGTLNSRLKFAHPIHNSDIDIGHVMPSQKEKNPMIIKFVRKSVRNQVFNSKSLLKATKESDPKLAITESLTRRRSKMLEQPKQVFGFQTFGHKKVIYFAVLKINDIELMILLTLLELDFLRNSLLLLF